MRHPHSDRGGLAVGRASGRNFHELHTRKSPEIEAALPESGGLKSTVLPTTCLTRGGISGGQLFATRPTSANLETTDDRAALTSLVIRAQAGDSAAQSDIVRLYSRRIAGFVRSIVREPNVIEDLTQTVFIKAIRRLPRLRDAVSFEAWLFALSRSTALDYLRSRRRRHEMLLEHPSHFETADPGRPWLMNEIVEALNLALTHLSPKDRTLVNMIVEGHSYQEIAAQEGLTLGAVKARLARVRPFLRAAVGAATGTRILRSDDLPLPGKQGLAAA